MTEENKEHWPEMHMKHLEILQNVISRMASNSASMKNYSMSIAAALIGLATAIPKPEIMFYSIPLIVIFGLVDAQYLRLERAFRDQYNSVRLAGLSDKPDFLVSPSWIAGNGIFAVICSWSVWLFYIPIILIFLGLGMIIG